MRKEKCKISNSLRDEAIKYIKNAEDILSKSSIEDNR
jgi:hypothetical protein